MMLILQQVKAFNERVVECVLLYNFDEKVLPPLCTNRAPLSSADGKSEAGDVSPDSGGAKKAEDEAASRAQRAIERESQPLTRLEEGSHGSGYKRLRSWRGAPLQGRFAEAWPKVQDQPPKAGNCTPFSDPSQLSMFALPQGTELRALPRKVPHKGGGSGGGGGSMMAPLPTRRTNLEQHSFVWTNYWDNDSMPDMPGESSSSTTQVQDLASSAGSERQQPLSGALLEACDGDEVRTRALQDLGVEAEGCAGEDRSRLYFHAATIWTPLPADRNEQVCNKCELSFSFCKLVC
jgi:hypothetical protein